MIKEPRCPKCNGRLIECFPNCKYRYLKIMPISLVLVAVILTITLLVK